MFASYLIIAWLWELIKRFSVNISLTNKHCIRNKKDVWLENTEWIRPSLKQFNNRTLISQPILANDINQKMPLRISGFLEILKSNILYRDLKGSLQSIQMCLYLYIISSLPIAYSGLGFNCIYCYCLSSYDSVLILN